MTWIKGQSGNPKGRPKGSKNKTTAEIRKLLQEAVSAHIDALEDDMGAMKATDRWFIIERFMKYFLPTLSKTDVTQTNKEPLKIEVTYEDKPSADKKDETMNE